MGAIANRPIEVQVFLRVAREVMTLRRGRDAQSLDLLYSLAVDMRPEQYLLSRTLMNDQHDIDAYLREANAQLEKGDCLIGHANYMLGYDTKVFQKGRFIPKIGLRQLAFLYHRVFAKLSWGVSLYKWITNGRMKRLSKTEILGRLAYAGFKIDKVHTVESMLYFRVEKRSAPLEGYSPTYGPFIKLKRMVKNGRFCKIYKFRTMHPYAEFIQDYIYEQNELATGGKIRNDFRVSEEGNIFRKYFLDELPMLFNLLKGDIKLVGVRPLSEHYFSLYTEAMRRKRIEHKPGLFPPYYSEEKKPETLEEIMVSEMRYLIQYEKSPLKTDIKYFIRIWKNILFNNQRSQ